MWKNYLSTIKPKRLNEGAHIRNQKWLWYYEVTRNKELQPLKQGLVDDFKLPFLQYATRYTHLSNENITIIIIILWMYIVNVKQQEFIIRNIVAFWYVTK